MSYETEDINMTKFIWSVSALSFLQYSLTHPIDVVITKKQTIGVPLSIYSYFSYIYRNNYTYCLTRGLFASVGGFTLGQTVNLGIVKYFNSNPVFSDPNQNIMFSGSIGNLTGCLFSYPFSMMSIMQIAYKKKYNICTLSNTLYKRNGVRSFYSGAGLYALSDAAWSGLWWVLYENMKLYSRHYTTDYDFVTNGCCSLGSSVVTAALFNPLSIIITKRQANRHSNYLGIIRSIYSKHGMRGFWRAMMLNTSASIYTDFLFSLNYETSIKYSKS